MADSHEILQDLKRVASLLGHIPTRREYREHGSIPDTQLERIFGGFTPALIAAGLNKERPKKDVKDPVVSKIEKQFASHDQKIKLMQRFEKEIMPWVGRYDRLSKEVITLMIRGDDHAQWVDPFCNDVFFDVALRIQPDGIVFAGDTVDFWEISSHSKNPRRQMTFQSEINFSNKHFFEAARMACPKAQIDWLLGNHEWRLFRYLSDQAPALASLECLQFDKLFNLKEYDINLVARASFLNARNSKDLENYKIYADSFAITHGTRLGSQPAQKEMDVWGHSGCSQHVHRYTTFAWRNLYGYHRWTTNGAMCQLKSGEEYIPDLVDWNQGFMIVHIDRGRVFQEYIDCTSGFVNVGGVYYRREESLKKDSTI